MDFPHKSFSKNDMIELIEIFRMDIDYFDLSKTKLSSKLVRYIQEHEEFTPKKEYFINNKDELIDYLSKPNQLKVSTYQKKEIMYISKNIILYCRQNSLYNTTFNDENELIESAQYIKFYGDIPTVRRALKMLNEKNKLDIPIIISPKVKFELNNRNKLKKEKNIIEFKYGSFILFG
jgi:hypothetical protein